MVEKTFEFFNVFFFFFLECASHSMLIAKVLHNFLIHTRTTDGGRPKQTKTMPEKKKKNVYELKFTGYLA